MNYKLLKKELDFIRGAKTVSIFWVTKTTARAKRITWLENHGVIERTDKRDRYPYIDYLVHEEKLSGISTKESEG